MVSGQRPRGTLEKSSIPTQRHHMADTAADLLSPLPSGNVQAPRRVRSANG
jgi:hypothetical protein